jgi:hypothetical protein
VKFLARMGKFTNTLLQTESILSINIVFVLAICALQMVLKMNPAISNIFFIKKFLAFKSNFLFNTAK